MSTLADLLNSVSEAFTGGSTNGKLPPSPQPAWQRAITNPVLGFAEKIVRGVAQEADTKSLTDAFTRINPITAPMRVVQDYQEGGVDKVVNNARTIAGDVAQIPTDIVAAVPGLWALAGLGTKKAFDYDLPGAQGAADATLAIKKFGEENIGEPIAGKKLNDSLLQGDGADVAGSWARLLGGATISAPFNLPKIATNIEAINKIGNAAIQTAEVLTPVIIAKNPSAALMGTSAGVAAGLGVGLEGALGSSDDPEQVKAKLDAFSKSAQDQAAEGIKEGKAIQAGFSTGDDLADAGLVIGLGAASIFAGYKSDLVRRAFTGLTKDETTQVPTGVILKEQGGYAPAPVDWAARKLIGDPHTTWERLSQGLSGAPRNKLARDQGDKFAADMDERYGASIDAKMRHTWDTGELPYSNIKIPAPNDLFTHVKNLDEVKMQDVVRRLNARQEINNRQSNAVADKTLGVKLQAPGTQVADTLFQGITRQRGWDDSKVAHHMSNVSTQDLYKIVNAPMDPAVKQAVDGYRAIMSKIPNYLHEQRGLTKKEAQAFMRQNPHYVANKLVEGKSHLSTNEVKPGQGLIDPGNPFEELPKYLDEVVRFVENNKTVRSFIRVLESKAAQGDTFAKSLIGRKDAKLHESKTASDKTVRYRDDYGVARDIEINDPVLRRALQGLGSPAQLMLLRGQMKTASNIARGFEAGAVGPLAAATGSIFGPTSAMYSMLAGTIYRDARHGAAGWIDKGLQELTKKVFPKDSYFHGAGMRGDPTIAADYAFRVAQGMQAMFAQRAARALKDSIITDGFLSKTLSPQVAQMYADKMSDVFKRSWVSKLQQDGQMGPASLMSVDYSKRYADTLAMLQSPKGVMAKSVAGIGSAYRTLEDVLHILSSAPAASLMAINKNNDAWRTKTLIRNFSGDPGKSGAFSAPAFQKLGKLTAASPWGNIYIQGLMRIGKAFKDDPVATSTGIATLIGMPTALATIHNATSGEYVDPATGKVENYSDYQFNKRSPDRQAGYLYIAKPGLPPEQGFEIPIEPVLGPFKYAAELMQGTRLGLLDGSLFQPGNENLRQALEEAVGKRNSFFGEGSTSRAVAQRSLVPPVPPVWAAGAAAMGVKLRSYGDTSPIPEGRDGGFTNSTAKNPNRSVLGFNEPAWAEEVIASIGADAGRVIYNTLMDSAQMLNEGKGERIVPNVAKKYSQRLGDSTKYVSGPLFESFQTVSPSLEAAGQASKSKLEGMKRLTEAYRDVTGPGGVPTGNMVGNNKRGSQPGPGEAPAVGDPNVMYLAQTIASVYPKLSSSYGGENSDLYTKRAQVANSTRYSPQEKRALMNAYAEQIITNNRRTLMHIQMIERNLSNQFGVQISLDKGIDLKRGMDQFKPLTNY
jgi:hypothetical protein